MLVATRTLRTDNELLNQYLELDKYAHVMFTECNGIYYYKNLRISCISSGSYMGLNKDHRVKYIKSGMKAIARDVADYVCTSMIGLNINWTTMLSNHINLHIDTKVAKDDITEINKYTYCKLRVSKSSAILTRLNTHAETLLLRCKHKNYPRLTCEYLFANYNVNYTIDFSSILYICGNVPCNSDTLLFASNTYQYNMTPNILGYYNNGNMYLNETHKHIELLKTLDAIDGMDLVKKYNLAIRSLRTKSARY